MISFLRSQRLTVASGLLALTGAGAWLVDLLTGHELPWSSELTAVACLCAWILSSLVWTYLHHQQKRITNSYRSLWEIERQKNRSWLS